MAFCELFSLLSNSFVIASFFSSIRLRCMYFFYSSVVIVFWDFFDTDAINRNFFLSQRYTVDYLLFFLQSE